MRHWGKTMQRFLVDHVKSIYPMYLLATTTHIRDIYAKQTHVHVTLSSAHIHIAVPSVSAVAHVHARVVVVHREIAVV